MYHLVAIPDYSKRRWLVAYCISSYDGVKFFMMIIDTLFYRFSLPKRYYDDDDCDDDNDDNGESFSQALPPKKKKSSEFIAALYPHLYRSFDADE